jgi:ABC transport system ATP-binding/permease protein
MNESVLQALMRLFAIVANVNDEGFARNERDVVVEYLQRQFSNELVEQYLLFFDQYLREYHHINREISDDELIQQHLEKSNDIETLCVKLNNELEQQQKILILLYLLDFIKRDEEPSKREIDFITTVAVNLRIGQGEFSDTKSFTFDNINEVKSKSNLLFIDGGTAPKEKQIKHLYIDKLEGRIIVLHILSTNTYVFRYNGPQALLMNGHNIKANRSYIWDFGSVIKNPRFGSIYYTWVAGRFIKAISKSNFVFTAKNIEYSYGNGPNGIKRFNLNEESGRLIGIIGGSGSGKSTLLKVLSGVIKPKRGTIQINGFDIHENKEELKGITGYVPQDDTLIKEFTVYENLYFNARLSFSKSTEEQIKTIINEALLNFDLVEARNLHVGDSFSTFLSGGQRKRLNIALELLREPSVLFVDEPTSGLSSADSEKVMNLLKRQTFKGKLVFANIHQPSSEIFRLLDKLLVVDQGGRIIYYGNPIDAIGYFKRINHFVDAEESECLTCGNIDVDQILRNVEARVIDVNGRLTRTRKISPQEWYDIYMERIDPAIRRIRRPFNAIIPKNFYRIPTRLNQFKIFLQRDVLKKLKNQQYQVITLLEAPVLAMILSFYTRSARDVSGALTNYSFSHNANIPAYLFMSVIVALFLGLVISAEEIFKDRKILERERFLSLSRWSYMSSKITIMFLISAIQMFLFVFIGNHILGIENMTWRYFLILFTTSCWANVIGLNISSGLKSVVTIYILVPLILVPQLLFSGVVVNFRNLNKAIYSDKYVPAVGEIMTSRWSYEALVVTQFKDNPFEKNIYGPERLVDEAMYNKAYLIPKIQSTLDELKTNIDNRKEFETLQNDFGIVRNETRKIAFNLQVPVPEFLADLQVDRFTEDTYQKEKEFLDQAWKSYNADYLDALKLKEQALDVLMNKKRSTDALINLKREYYNDQLASLVKNEKEMIEMYVVGKDIIRLKNPIYTLPESNFGRAHFYAPYKKVAGTYIDTFWFNIIVIWLWTGFWFAVLYYDILKKLMNYFDSIKIQRFNRRILLILKQYEIR